GYNGADLEAVVKDAIESAFINGASEITTEDLIESIKDTKSISKTLKDKIDQIKQTISKIDIKQASNSDNEPRNNKNSKDIDIKANNIINKPTVSPIVGRDLSIGFKQL
ncbi:ATP-binding protein, partial [Burkholderia pseudomallei]